MAPQKLTEYERKRLENIRRNDEMMAALKIHSKATEVSAAAKRSRVGTKSYTVKSEKKPKTETPVVIRRSLRTRGMPPDSKSLNDVALDAVSVSEKSPTKMKPSVKSLGPLAMRDAYSGSESDRSFVEAIVGMAKKEARFRALIKEEVGSCKDGNVLTDVKEESVVVPCDPTESDHSFGEANVGLAKMGAHSRALVKEEFGCCKDGNVLTDVKEESVVVSCDPTESDRSFGEANLGLAKMEAHSRVLVKEEFGSCKDGNMFNDVKEEGDGVSCDIARTKDNKVWASLKLESLTLDSENIARVVPGRITVARFFPSSTAKMVVAGNKFGNIGFWDFDYANNEGSEVHLYRPHPAPISGILVQRHCLSKIYTSCYDGFIRLMDAEKDIFDLVFSSDETIYTLSQPKDDANCLYFGEGRGGLTIWDNRMGKCSSQWVLHEDRINTIDFNSENPHIMATSSSDGTACTWDLRYTNGDKLRALRTFTHKRAVHSAYFSPSGSSLATTSMDNTIGIYGGVNFENASTIYHDNQTGRWISSFRAIWGWDDSYLFVGNMKRGVDVVSLVHKKTIMTLRSPHITAIPCRFDAHPYEVGTLAGATSGGQVYVWTSC